MARGRAPTGADTMACQSRLAVPSSFGNDNSFKTKEVLRTAEQIVSARFQQQMLQSFLRTSSQQPQQTAQVVSKSRNGMTDISGPASLAYEGSLTPVASVIPMANGNGEASQDSALGVVSKLTGIPEYFLPMVFAAQMQQQREQQRVRLLEAVSGAALAKAAVGSEHASRKRAFTGIPVETSNLLARGPDGNLPLPLASLAQQIQQLATSPAPNDGGRVSSTLLANAQQRKFTDAPWMTTHGYMASGKGREAAAWNCGEQAVPDQRVGAPGTSLPTSTELQALFSRSAPPTGGLRMSAGGMEITRDHPFLKDANLPDFQPIGSAFGVRKCGEGTASSLQFGAFGMKCLTEDSQTSNFGQQSIEQQSVKVANSAAAQQIYSADKGYLTKLEDLAAALTRSDDGVAPAEKVTARHGVSISNERDQALQLAAEFLRTRSGSSESGEAGRAGGCAQRPYIFGQANSAFSEPSMSEGQHAETISHRVNGHAFESPQGQPMGAGANFPDHRLGFSSTTAAICDSSSGNTGATLQLRQQQVQQQELQARYIPPMVTEPQRSACLPAEREEYDQQPPLKRKASGDGSAPSLTPTIVIRPIASKGGVSLVPPPSSASLPPGPSQGSPPKYIRPLQTQKTAPPAMIAEAAERLLRGDRPLNRAMSTPTLGVFSLFGQKSVPVPAALHPTSKEPSIDAVDTSLSLRIA
eukprot:TRINITY_DN26559_c0_g1_i1.p1 TRINITY_DN26559_c0_g1~~TRINITY_DN26559_c0_g1_i1.p1  ORF type:complete len:697 (+),score=116.28 TRINITY_DN26559_c0_g1_i1:520-2610(+)